MKQLTETLAAAFPDVREEDCARHGHFTSHAIAPPDGDMRGIWSECPHCLREQGEERERLEVQRRQRERTEAITKRFTETAVPPRFAGCTFENYRASTDEQQHALRVTRAFAAKFQTVLDRGGSLTLTGPTGTGKTHLAAAVMRAITEAGHTGMYRLADAAVRYLKSAYNPGNSYTEDQALAHLRMPALLVLDEIGNQHDTADEKRVLFAILNARYSHMRPTLLVSNLTGDQLRQWAGQAFHDRLLEGGHIVPCQWPSYRGRKGEAS